MERAPLAPISFLRSAKSEIRLFDCQKQSFFNDESKQQRMQSKQETNALNKQARTCLEQIAAGHGANRSQRVLRELELVQHGVVLQQQTRSPQCEE